MAVTKTFMKKTHQTVDVRVAGTADAVTINLATDLLPTGQVLDGSTQKVSIIGVNWSGASGGLVTITRNNVVIMSLQTSSAGMLNFDGQQMNPENTEEASNIVVTISGAQAECWLRLRKTFGYKTTIEPEQFSIYDNPAVAGS